MNKKSDAIHLPGSKVIQAFHEGEKNIDDNYDIIVKADADLIFPKNNTSGMDAKASGYRADSTAVFEGKGIKAFWWASNQKDSVKAYRISVSYNLSAVETGFAKFGNGFSVRCIKDSI